MDKLYYIVCEDRDATLFEGRYQGRTRGAALKFLKQSLGRKSLNGLVFTITEIPVPLIREIVAEILAGMNISAMASPAPIVAPEPSAGRFDAFSEAAEPVEDLHPASPPPASCAKPKGKAGNPGRGEDFWNVVRAYWLECRSVKRTAEHFELSPNSIKTRARREAWGKQQAQP